MHPERFFAQDRFPYAWMAAYPPLPPIRSLYRSGSQQGEPAPSLTFVLVHGSWADASYWSEVASELRRQGHIVHVPEYPGHGPDYNPGVTHEAITRAVAATITGCGLSDVRLVGHSFGGSVIQKTAELVPDRIRRIIFMNAFVLKDGQSVADELPPPVQQSFIQLRQSSPDDTIMLPYPLFRDTFANLADKRLADHLYSRMVPEPAKPLFEKLDLKKFYGLEIPRSYLYLTTDGVLPQGEGYGWHPHMSGRLGVFRLIKTEGDHMSTVKTAPARIAAGLYEAARD
ncbi:alpha/beta fold hydrolase [Paenibacillus humicus]|uniref:alpha/beta fold hydrolase n=1 Tax=Paenibacillus humicus TaxID=412861 RepID=UPI003F5CCA4A